MMMMQAGTTGEDTLVPGSGDVRLTRLQTASVAVYWSGRCLAPHSFVPQDCSCAARALQQHNMNPGLGSLPPGPEQSSICEYFKADVVKRSLRRAVDVTPKKPIMVFRMIHLTLESWTVHSFFYHHRIVSS